MPGILPLSFIAPSEMDDLKWLGQSPAVNGDPLCEKTLALLFKRTSEPKPLLVGRGQLEGAFVSFPGYILDTGPRSPGAAASAFRSLNHLTGCYTSWQPANAEPHWCVDFLTFSGFILRLWASHCLSIVNVFSFVLRSSWSSLSLLRGAFSSEVISQLSL